jgi:hypothetical protein
MVVAAAEGGERRRVARVINAAVRHGHVSLVVHGVIYRVGLLLVENSAQNPILLHIHAYTHTNTSMKNLILRKNLPT